MPIEFQSIRKVFDGGVVAVDDFTLEVEDGEFIVLVGPSGCGKTTTLRMLAGLITPSSGEIHMDGKRIDHLPPKARDIAMVFQNYALYPHMSVFENIAFGLEMRKVPRQEIFERVHEVAQSLQIEHLLARKPRALSGGQRQRVALGRAIVRRPKVFLMDEPLSNLDAQLRAQTRMEIIRLHKQLGTTFIYVTHDQTEAMTMGTRIVVMKDALIQQTDTPQQLYREPQNAFVAQFIGSPPMNLLPGEAVDGGVRIGDMLLPVEIEQRGAVKFGIRPEVVRIDASAPMFRANVDVIEDLGGQCFVHMMWPGLDNTFIARMDTAEDAREGGEAPVSFAMKDIRLFDEETGERIM